MKKIVAILLAVSVAAIAKSAPVSIELTSLQKSVKVDKKGKKKIEWVKPTKVVPKSVIKYVNTIKNDTNTTLEKAVVTNKIDKNVLFQEGSIESKLKYSVKFSVDNGKSFAPKDKLFVVQKDGKKRKATVKDYTALAFEVKDIPANSKETISYQVKIK